MSDSVYPSTIHLHTDATMVLEMGVIWRLYGAYITRHIVNIYTTPFTSTKCLRWHHTHTQTLYGDSHIHEYTAIWRLVFCMLSCSCVCCSVQTNTEGGRSAHIYRLHRALWPLCREDNSLPSLSYSPRVSIYGCCPSSSHSVLISLIILSWFYASISIPCQA